MVNIVYNNKLILLLLVNHISDVRNPIIRSSDFWRQLFVCYYEWWFPLFSLKKWQFLAKKAIFWPPKIFSRKSAYITFLESLQASLVQKISKILWSVFEKIEKMAIFWRKTAFFDPPKFFFENPPPSPFRNHNRLVWCKKLKKSNERFSRKTPNRRTDGRTDARTRVNL